MYPVVKRKMDMQIAKRLWDEIIFCILWESTTRKMHWNTRNNVTAFQSNFSLYSVYYQYSFNECYKFLVIDILFNADNVFYRL